jgi:hypothetical protein
MEQAVNLVAFLATLYIAAKFLMAKSQPRAELAQGEFDFTGLKEPRSVQDVDFNELIAECTPHCENDSAFAKPLSVLQKYQAAYDAYQNNLLNSEKLKTKMDTHRSLTETDKSQLQYETYNQAQLDYVLASSAAEGNLLDIRNISKNIDEQLRSVVSTLGQDLAKIIKYFEHRKSDVLDSTLDDLSQQQRETLVNDYRQAADNQLQQDKSRLISEVKLLRALLAVKKMTHSPVVAETTSGNLDDNLIRLLSLIDVHNNDELIRNCDQAQKLVVMISDEVAPQKQISEPIQSEQKAIRINRLEQWSQILLDTLKKSIKQSSQKTLGVSKGPNTPGTPKEQVRQAFDDFRQLYEQLYKKSESWRKTSDFAQYVGINGIFHEITSIQSALDTQVSNNGAADPTGEYSTNMIKIICQSQEPVLNPILLTDVRDKNNKMHLSESEAADNNLVDRYENNTENPIHIIHHRDSHFVAAAIYRDDDNKPHIIVHDPLGNPNNTTVRIANLLGGSPQPTIHQNGENDIHNQHNLQQDRINCGPLSIELISRLDEKTCARIAKRQKTVSSISTDIAKSEPYVSRSGEWSNVSRDAANLLRAKQFRSVVDYCKKLNDTLPLMNDNNPPSP